VPLEGKLAVGVIRQNHDAKVNTGQKDANGRLAAHLKRFYDLAGSQRNTSPVIYHSAPEPRKSEKGFAWHLRRDYRKVFMSTITDKCFSSH